LATGGGASEAALEDRDWWPEPLLRRSYLFPSLASLLTFIGCHGHLWPPSSPSRAATAMVAGGPKLLIPLLVLTMVAGRVLQEEARPCSSAAGLTQGEVNAS
jgi:hypothetical protein